MNPDPAPDSRTRHRRLSPDLLAVLALIALWALYFWRILTPDAQDALSLKEGDFSGQFVAFFGYQTERLSHGEIPLWDPYQYAGFPFLADTQSAVFYPPRLLTVALVSLGGDPSPGELYAALQTEMALHVLLGTLLMYAFVRRLTAPEDGASARPSVFGAMVAALTFGYGGYLSGYPQLQLAVMEAGIWLPLALLAVFQATRTSRPGWPCLVLAGAAMGLSLLAGHPQTSLFALYCALAFLAYRLWPRAGEPGRAAARRFVWAAGLFGVIAGGLAAVQLLPGLEYLRHASRSALSFDAKGNGFPFMDVAQVLFPGFISLWSPLYVGIAGLILAGLAIGRRTPHSRFFGIAALVALGLSFGVGTVIYDLAYLVVPGVSWFRGQERAAFIIAQSLSILAGLGAAHALASDPVRGLAARQVRRVLLGLVVLCAVFAAVLFVLWRTPDGSTYERALRSAAFATLLAALAAAVFPGLLRAPVDLRRALALVSLVVFDLFSVTMGAANFDPVRASDRLPEPAAIHELRAQLPPGARVDGVRGVRDNYGTLYAIPDIRTISPLRMRSIENILALPGGRPWELLAVRYVLTDWTELPVPSTITGMAEDAFGPYNIHRIDDPRDFAHLTYGATVVGSDAEAYGLLRESAYDTRQFAILDRDPGVELPGKAPDGPGRTQITTFEPEKIVVEVAAPSAAVLTLALADYPGWRATINGKQAPILRAYGGLSAVALPAAGVYALELTYHPWTYTVGAAITVLTLLLVILATAAAWTTARRSARDVQHYGSA